MRRRMFVIVGWLFVGIVSIGLMGVLSEEVCEAADTPIIEQLARLEYSDWQAKDKLVKEISSRKSTLSEVEKEQLIDIFDKESRFQEEYVGRLRNQGVPVNQAIDKFNREYRQKGYGNYFLSFARLIVSFRNTKSMPSLLRAYYYYGGAVAPTIIIGMGEHAIEPLLSCLDSEDRIVRNTSYAVLAGWVNAPVKAEDYTITEEMGIKDKRTLDKIRIAFLRALNDKDIDVRSAAVEGLIPFPEEDVLRALEEVAKHDPYSFYSKFEKKMKYPIREEARKSIEKIRAKMNAHGDK